MLGGMFGRDGRPDASTEELHDLFCSTNRPVTMTNRLRRMACDKHGRNANKVLSESVKESDYLGDVVADAII